MERRFAWRVKSLAARPAARGTIPTRSGASPDAVECPFTSHQLPEILNVACTSGLPRPRRAALRAHPALAARRTGERVRRGTRRAAAQAGAASHLARHLGG